MAVKKQYPRFAQASTDDSSKLQNKAFERIKESEKLSKEDDPNRRVPRGISREQFDDEDIIGVEDAWSNSVYEQNFLLWNHRYPAINAVRSFSYWCSKGGHKKNDEVIFDAKLFRLTRVHAINMIWAYAPERYKIQYSYDGQKFIDLVKWKDAIEGKKSGWWKKLIPALKFKNQSFPDRITFDNAIFARKFRIIMKGPVNGFFGLYKVDFFVRNWVVIFKNTPEDQCKESCWTVNTVNILPDTQIQCNN